jgi:hypothetical protein
MADDNKNDSSESDNGEDKEGIRGILKGGGFRIGRILRRSPEPPSPPKIV